MRLRFQFIIWICVCNLNKLSIKIPCPLKLTQWDSAEVGEVTDFCPEAEKRKSPEAGRPLSLVFGVVLLEPVP